MIAKPDDVLRVLEEEGRGESWGSSCSPAISVARRAVELGFIWVWAGHHESA
jgi:hypothetical protein